MTPPETVSGLDDFEIQANISILFSR